MESTSKIFDIKTERIWLHFTYCFLSLLALIVFSNISATLKDIILIFLLLLFKSYFKIEKNNFKVKGAH